jgi:hypothetical protein
MDWKWIQDLLKSREKQEEKIGEHFDSLIHD